MVDLAGKALADRERQRTENRRNFPLAAEMMEMFAEFNPRIVYAEENGKSIGKKPEAYGTVDASRLVDLIDASDRMVANMNPRRRK